NDPLSNLDPDGASSVSAVYKIGTADITIWAQSRQGAVDIAGLLNAMYPVKVFPYNKSTAIGQDAFFSGERRSVNLPAQGSSDLGGCVLTCNFGYEGLTTGYDVNISFSYGKDGNGPIDGVNIILAENPDLRYVGNPLRLEVGTPVPGGLGYPPDINLNLNQSQFARFSPEQLSALGKAVAGRVDDLSLAIAAAVAREEKRRADAANKRKDCAGPDGGKGHDQCKK